MNCTAKLAIALAITVAIGALTASAKSSCVLAGGEATMVTENLARFMANKALGNSIKGMGATPSGGVKMTCSPATLGSYCIARQRSCKG